MSPPRDRGATGTGDQENACGVLEPAPLRRLSRTEYDNIVEDLLRHSSRPASRTWPAPGSSTSFDNDVVGQTVAELDVEGFVRTAELVADEAATRVDALVSCPTEGEPTRACVLAFLRTFARRAYRGLGTEAEDVALERLASAGYEEGGARESLAHGIVYVLASPRFLYRFEIGAHDQEVAGLELASRLSFFLTGSVPDEALLRTAEANELAADDVIVRETKRLLATPHARRHVRHLFSQAFGLHRIEETIKVDAVAPDFEEIRDDLGAAAEAFVEHVFFDAEERTLGELLTAPYAFVGPENASLYGVSAPASPGITPVSSPDSPRAGLLTDVGLLSVLAHADQSSPITRGLFVRTRLLCQSISPPPAELLVEPPSPDPTLTTRERFARHTSDPSCRGCHELIDPIGFGFERYDAVGRYRERENGQVIDESGELTRAGTGDGTYAGVVELAGRLAASDAAAECMVRTFLSQALGRALGEADECALEAITDAFIEDGGRFETLVLRVVTSDVFRRPTLAPGSCS